MAWNSALTKILAVSITALGTVVVAVISNWQDLVRYSSNVSAASKPHVAEQTVASSAPIAVKSVTDVLQVPDRESFVLTGRYGIVVVQLFQNGPGCASKYRWRYSPRRGAPESTGSGEVFEQYAKRPMPNGKVVGTDVGGQLVLRAGPYEVQWSCAGGAYAGWIYGRPPLVTVAGLSPVPFEDFRL